MSGMVLMIYDGLCLNTVMKQEYAAWGSVFAIIGKTFISFMSSSFLFWTYSHLYLGRGTFSWKSQGGFILIWSIIWTRKNNTWFIQHWNEEKYLERLQMNILNSYCEKREHHLHYVMLRSLFSFRSLRGMIHLDHLE